MNLKRIGWILLTLGGAGIIGGAISQTTPPGSSPPGNPSPSSGSATGTGAPTGADPVALRAQAATPQTTPLVLALYYPWYALKAVSGADRHIQNWDPVAQTVSNFAHYPVGGPYDSDDPTTVNRQLTQLKAAGVDALAVSWFGASDPSFKAVHDLLPLAQAAGLKVCLFLEHLQSVQSPADTGPAAQEIAGLLKDLGSNPAYLQAGGKPVLFLYDHARDPLGNPGWAQVLVSLSSLLPNGVAAIGDVEDGADPTDAEVFDGLHYNGPSVWVAESIAAHPRAYLRPSMRQAFHDQTQETAFDAASSHHRLMVATVSPGFDDRELGASGLNLFNDREGGQCYQDAWTSAMKANPNWVLIQSFNQWHDGTEIEPSREFGSQYLTLTQTYAAQFKGAATAQSRARKDRFVYRKPGSSRVASVKNSAQRRKTVAGTSTQQPSTSAPSAAIRIASRSSRAGG